MRKKRKISFLFRVFSLSLQKTNKTDFSGFFPKFDILIRQTINSQIVVTIWGGYFGNHKIHADNPKSVFFVVREGNPSILATPVPVFPC